MAAQRFQPDTHRFSAGDAVLSALGATLLIVTEMLGAAFAFAWAIGSLLGLGEIGTWILMAIVAVPGLAASLALTRRVLKVENGLRKNPPTA